MYFMFRQVHYLIKYKCLSFQNLKYTYRNIVDETWASCNTVMLSKSYCSQNDECKLVLKVTVYPPTVLNMPRVVSLESIERVKSGLVFYILLQW